MQKITLEQIIEITTSKEKRLAVFLGAGCSKSSGIPLGGEVTELLEYLLIEKNKPTIKKSFFKENVMFDYANVISYYRNDRFINKVKPKLLQTWKNENINYIRKTITRNEFLLSEMPGIKSNCLADLTDKEWQEIIEDSWYSFLFQKYLEGDKTRQAKFFEKIVQEKNPSMGYLHLAVLMRLGYFNAVITTNFDKLIEKAFDDYSLGNCNIKTFLKLIENNETFSTRYIPNSNHALPKENNLMPLYKIHGGYFSIDLKNSFEDLNFSDNKLYHVFEEQNYLLVIGFSGADFRVMNRLQKFLENTDKQIIWISRDQAIERLHNNVKALLKFSNFYFFSLQENNLDFDSFWASITTQIVPLPLLNQKVAQYKLSYVNDFQYQQKLFDYTNATATFSKYNTVALVATYNSEQKKYNKSPEKYALLCYHIEQRIKKGVNISLDFFNFYYGWGNNLLRAGYFKSAITIYLKAKTEATNWDEKIEAQQNIAICYRQLGNFQKAVSGYREINDQLLNQPIRNKNWYKLQITVYYNLSEIFRAIGDFKQAYLYIESSQNQYKTALSEGKLDKAEFDAVLNIKDSYFDTNKAYILAQLNNISQAVALYENLIQTMTEENYDALAEANYAYHLTSEKKYDEAFQHFYRAFIKKPLDTNIAIGLFYTSEKGVFITQEQQKEIDRVLDYHYQYTLHPDKTITEVYIKACLALFNIAKKEVYHNTLLQKAQEIFPIFIYERLSFEYENTYLANFAFYIKPTADYRNHTLVVV